MRQTAQMWVHADIRRHFLEFHRAEPNREGDVTLRAFLPDGREAAGTNSGALDTQDRSAAPQPASLGLLSLDRILLVRPRDRRELDPGMTPALVDGNPRRRKARIGERADRNADRPLVTFLRVEHRGAADRAEAESEPGALITGADVFGGSAGYLIRRRKAGKRGEDGSCSPLALEAVTNANPTRFAVNLDPELAARAGSDSTGHEKSGVTARSCPQ